MESLGNLPDPFLAEITGQPHALRRTALALAGQRRGLDRLGRAGRSRVVLTGMGSSYHACYPTVAALAARGIGALHVDAAELLHFRLPILDADSLLVMVSQSGRSAEVVRLAEEVHSRPRPARPVTVGVTNGLDNPLAERVDLALDTDAGREEGPSTLTFAASLTALFGVSRVLGGDQVTDTLEAVQRGAERAARAAERVLDSAAAPGAELGAWFGEGRSIVLLGRGSARAAAEMGALSLKEVARLPAESLQAAQFRHGPLELAGPDLAAVIFATEPETEHMDRALGADLIDAGAAVLLVSPDGAAPSGARPVAIGDLPRELASAVSIIPVQLLAWRLALDRGRRPGSMTRATKVTTRE